MSISSQTKKRIGLRFRLVSASLIAAIALPLSAGAGTGGNTSNTLSFVGSLSAVSNGAAYSGSVDLSVTFFDAASSGVNLRNECFGGVSVTDGQFGVQLGSVTGFAPNLGAFMAAHPNVYAEIMVCDAGTACGTGCDAPMAPRLPVTSAPYAGVAGQALDVSGQTIHPAAIVVAPTGSITLGQDPTAAMHAATKQYVDNRIAAISGGTGGGGVGPTGAPGATGAAGVPGATGANGVAGTNGANGATGAAGAPGATGAAGVMGPTGAMGAMGLMGTTGATGASPWVLNGNNAYYSLGNVGIGTSTPSDMLHLYNPSSGSGMLMLESGTGMSPAVIDMKYPGGTAHLNGPASGTLFSITDASSNTAMVITGSSTYHVGFGTTNPGAPVHAATISSQPAIMADGNYTGIADSLALRNNYSGGPAANGIIGMNAGGFPAARVEFDYTDASATTNTPNGALKFSTASAGIIMPRMYIAPSGSVGIGTTSPTQGLDVQTTFGVGSGITAGSGITNMKLCSGSITSAVSVTSSAGASTTISCPGAAVGSIASCSTGSIVPPTIAWNGQVTTAGTITLRFVNSMSTGSVPTGSWTCMVVN